MIRKLLKGIKVLLILIVDLEGSEVKSIQKETPSDTKKPVVQEKIISNPKQQKGSKDLLTYDFVLNKVNQNFSLLAAAFQDMKIAEGELLSSRGAFDPVIRSFGSLNGGYYSNYRFDSMVEQPTTINGTSFFAGYRLGQGNFPAYYGERETNRYGEVRAGARVPLWRDRAIDKGRAEMKQAEIGLRLADLSVQQQKLEIFRNVSLRYWEWVASVEKYKIAKELYNIALERQKQISKRVGAGDIAKIEETDNERILLQRESILLGMEQAMEIMSNELAVYLQDEVNKKVNISLEQLPENPFMQISDILKLDIETEIEKAMDKRPELLRFKAQQDQNRIDQEMAKNQMKPGVDLIVAASQDFGPGSVTRSKTEFEATVVLNVPLATRTQQGKLKTSIAKNKKLDAQEEFLRNRIDADIRNHYKILETTRQRSTLARKELELAKKLEKAEIDRFRIGEGTLIIVNIREQTSAEAAVREIDAKADHNRAIVSFKASIADIIPK